MIHAGFSLRLAALLVFAGNFATASFVSALAQAPSQFVRSGDVLSCHIGTDCTEETIDGRTYFVMQTEKMIVKVAVEPNSRYSRIEVSVENRAKFNIHFAPADFRIERTEPKFKRLSYIEPANLKLPKVKASKSDASALRAPFASSFMGASHPAKPTMPQPTFLAASTLTPAQSVTGEVYFDRAKDSGTMSLLLPIAGSILEFPYVSSR